MDIQTLPSKSEPEGVTATPSVSDSPPLVILLPSPASAGELALAIQSLGLPCLLAFDSEMLAHWSEHEQVSGFLVYLDTPWIAEIAQTLILGGAAVVALSDDPDVRLKALNRDFEDVLPLSMASIEVAAKLRRRFVDGAHAIDVAEIKGPLRLDLASRRAWWWEEEVQLTPKVFDVVAYLAARRDRWITASRLLRRVGGTLEPGDRQSP